MKKIFSFLFISFLIAGIIPINYPESGSVAGEQYSLINKVEAKKKKSKEVSCKTYFGIKIKVSKSECKRIKKLNKSSKKIDKEYVSCANRYRDGLSDCIRSAKDQARKTGIPYTQELENWCINLWKVDEETQRCWDTRNQKIRSIWFQFLDSL